MNYLRLAKTRGGAPVAIFMETDDYVIGAYKSGSPTWQGWVPVRWPKLTPYINGRGPSGLDLLESPQKVRA